MDQSMWTTSSVPSTSAESTSVQISSFPLTIGGSSTNAGGFVSYTASGSSTTTTYTTTIPWHSYNTPYPTATVDDFVLRLFTPEERKTWLIENGYSETDEHVFYRAMEQKLKAILLTPKIKLNINLPKVGDTIK
jgi:hypothetical protein